MGTEEDYVNVEVEIWKCADCPYYWKGESECTSEQLHVEDSGVILEDCPFRQD